MNQRSVLKILKIIFQAPEHIPIHSTNTEKTYKEKSITMNDWTGDVCNSCQTVGKEQDDDD